VSGRSGHRWGSANRPTVGWLGCRTHDRRGEPRWGFGINDAPGNRAERDPCSVRSAGRCLGERATGPSPSLTTPVRRHTPPSPPQSPRRRLTGSRHDCLSPVPNRTAPSDAAERSRSSPSPARTTGTSLLTARVGFGHRQPAGTSELTRAGTLNMIERAGAIGDPARSKDPWQDPQPRASPRELRRERLGSRF
jgi:hypothetical protein